MGVHRLLVALLIAALSCQMAVGSDGDFSEGGEVATLDSSDLGESGPADPASVPLPSGAEDPEPAPYLPGDGGADLDDSIVDEAVKEPTFYHGCEFGKPSVKVETSVGDVSLIGLQDDGVSSMKIPAGYVVTIYSDKNYEGFSKTFVGGVVHCLSNYQMGEGKTWDNEISSVRVVTASLDKDDASGKERKLKEKLQKKKEENAIRREATQKVKVKENQMAIDEKKLATKEEYTKTEAQTEVKVKSAKKDHSNQKEAFDLAKNQAENLQKNNELAGKANEKGNKALDEKINKAADESKKFESASVVAKEKRTKATKAAASAQDAREKHLKAQDEGRQKSTKKEANVAANLAKERKGEEMAAKTSLTEADEANEEVQKSERFAKESKEKRETKLSQLKGDVKKANKKVSDAQRKMKKLSLMVSSNVKNERNAKSTEIMAKSTEKRAKDEESAREGTKERNRKIIQAKESTAKAVRKRVAYSVKKAKAVNELHEKRERNAKGSKDKVERDCKESDKKIDDKKELLEKAQVKERAKKVADLKRKMHLAAAAAKYANKKQAKAERTVVRQRKRRAADEEETGQKDIKKRIAIQKMAANSEIIAKGKLAISNRQLEQATQIAQEFGEKNRRMKLADRKMMEERQKRSASLESKNKREAKDAAISDEAAAKAESLALQNLDKKNRAMDKKKRKLERTEKNIVRVTDEANVLRLENEVSNKKLRVLGRAVEKVDLKIEKETRNSELKKKESEKRGKQATEIDSKKETTSADLKKDRKRKEKQAEDFNQRAAELETQKEASEKTFMKAKEGEEKVAMQQDGIDRSAKLSTASVKEKGEKVSAAYTAKDSASEKAEKAAADEDSDPGAEGAHRDAANAAKKKLTKIKAMEVKSKNQQKEIIGKKTRIKETKAKLLAQSEAADQKSELRSKKEKKLKLESDSAKELGTKDKTRENGIKTKADEAKGKADLVARNYRATTEKIIDLRRAQEAEGKRMERAQQEKNELKSKHDAKNQYIQEQDVRAQEGQRKVARAKQDRANARQAKSEKQAKAGKVLILNLHQKLGSLKATTEKHTKESKVKMGRTAQKKLDKVKALKDIERERSKEKAAAQVLQVGASHKIQTMNLDITKRGDELQANKDELDAATSKEKKQMLIDKENELTEKLDDKKKAQQNVVDDSVEIKISYERSLAAEVKAKDDVKAMSKLAEIYSDAEDNIESLNQDKLKARREQLARENGMKQKYKEKLEDKDRAKHNEQTAKYLTRESITKIEGARRAEKRAVARAQKAQHKEYTYQQAIDEKRRKISMNRIAAALQARKEAAKDLREAYVKKAETQANTLLLSSEKLRKTTRIVDENRELSEKLDEKDKLYRTQLDSLSAERKAARESYNLRKSPEGKAIGKKMLDRATEKRDEAQAKYSDVHKRKLDVDAKLRKGFEDRKVDQEKYDSDEKIKTRTDEKTEKATQECDSTDDAGQGMLSKLKNLKTQYADMRIRIRAHNERVTKKSEALGVWQKLKDVARNAGDSTDDTLVDRGTDFKLDPEASMEQSPRKQKELLAKKVLAQQSVSATSLAKRILGHDGAVKRTKFHGPEEEGAEAHPLSGYVADKTKAGSSIFLPPSQQKENKAKAAAANTHLQTLKANSQRPKSTLTGADDTFDKWDKRVGGDWRALDAVAAIPSVDDTVLLQETEGEYDADVKAAEEALADALVQGAKNDRIRARTDEEAEL